MSIQTTWDLAKHFYSSPLDPQIELDLQKVEEVHQSFADKYQASDGFLSDSEALREALDAYDNLSGIAPYYYFNYLQCLNSADEEVEARLSQLSDFYSKLENKVVFFGLKLGKISQAQQEVFLADPILAPYRHYLKQLFENARYDLSEEVEQIVNRLDLPSASLWSQGVTKQLNKSTVRFNGKALALPAASNLIPELPLNERHALHAKLMHAIRRHTGFAESEINALYIRKKILDNERGLKNPYTASVLGNDNTEEEVMSLVAAVTDNFDIAGRFYAAKAQMLNQDVLGYADRSAKAGDLDLAITFESSFYLLRDLFGTLKPEYAQILVEMHQNGQVDVYPRKGKRGGAFCSSSSETPTFVLLNWVDSLHAHLTHAHEFGHAVHAQRSKMQEIRLYQGSSLSLAETASTFFEGMAFDALLPDLSPEQQIVALHDQIQGDVSTIFRQVACFNFELALHQKIRQEGYVSHEAISELMNEHMAAYLGPSVNLTKNDGYFWITWHHIRRFFYVYTYAYGQLVSRALRQKVKEDPAYINQVDRFLTAGESQSPSEILAGIGIETNAEFFEKGLSAVRQDVERLEELIGS